MNRPQVTRPKNRAGVSAVLLACLVLAALFFAGPASAYSRGFRLTNTGDETLTLVSASKIPAKLCNGYHCVQSHHPMSFEGRPKDGSTLKPGQVDVWELQSLPFEIYGAILKYEVADHLGHHLGIVEYTIKTSTLSNDSSCKVTPGAGKCTAGGLGLSFN
jgi:hypothetical protein